MASGNNLVGKLRLNAGDIVTLSGSKGAVTGHVVDYSLWTATLSTVDPHDSRGNLRRPAWYKGNQTYEKSVRVELKHFEKCDLLKAYTAPIVPSPVSGTSQQP